jgi:hypothetical protein
MLQTEAVEKNETYLMLKIIFLCHMVFKISEQKSVIVPEFLLCECTL